MAQRKRRAVKARRRPLVRAALLAAGLVGAPAVNALARGDAVTVAGPTVSLRVSRATTLAAAGHGALKVTLVDHGGAELADLCTYVEDTPALDQVAALALHMGAGLEAEVLAAANVTRWTEAGARHPLLAGRSRGNPVISARVLPSAEDAYYAGAGHIWREAVAVFLLGHRARELRFLVE